MSTELRARYARDHLTCNRTGCNEAFRGINPYTAYACPVLEHILKVYEVAVMHVLGEIIRVMEMDDTFSLGFEYVFRKQVFIGIMPAPLPGHVIPLYGQDGGVLIGVLLLYFLVQYRHGTVGIFRYFHDPLDLGVQFRHLPFFLVEMAVVMVEKEYAVRPFTNLFFNDVLDFFYAKRPCFLVDLGSNDLRDLGNLVLCQPLILYVYLFLEIAFLIFTGS